MGDGWSGSDLAGNEHLGDSSTHLPIDVGRRTFNELPLPRIALVSEVPGAQAPGSFCAAGARRPGGRALGDRLSPIPHRFVRISAVQDGSGTGGSACGPVHSPPAPNESTAGASRRSTGRQVGPWGASIRRGNLAARGREGRLGPAVEAPKGNLASRRRSSRLVKTFHLAKALDQFGRASDIQNQRGLSRTGLIVRFTSIDACGQRGTEVDPRADSCRPRL